MRTSVNLIAGGPGARWSGVWMAVTALALWVSGGNAWAMEPSLTAKKKMVLDPEVEKALAEFAEKGAAAKAGQFKKQMEKVVSAVTEMAQLSAAETATLSGAADKAVEESVEAWKPRYVAEMRLDVRELPPRQAKARILAWKAGDSSTQRFVEGAMRPDQLESWRAVVKACLGLERSLIWEKEVLKMENKRKQEILEYLAPLATGACRTLDKDIDMQIKSLAKSCRLQGAQNADLEQARNRVMSQIKEMETDREFRVLQTLTDDIWHNVYDLHRGWLKMDIPAKADDSAEWAGEVKRILTKEQGVVWEKARTDRERELTDEIVKGLQPVREMQREWYLKALADDVFSRSEAGAASPEHAKLLGVVAKEVVDSFMVEWQKKMVENLASRNEQQRKLAYARRLGIGLNMEGSSDARQIPMWIKKLDEILSAGEKQRWEMVMAERAIRASHCLACIALAEMDKRVMLSAAQRVKLEPVAQDLAKRYLTENGIRDNSDYEFEASNLVKMLAGAKAESVQPLLDEAQWKHWKDGLNDDGNDQRSGRVNSGAKKDGPAQTKVVSVKTTTRRPEPPRVDAIISEYLDEMSEKIAARQIAAMQLRVEEATRMGGLSPRAVARLTTAAKGAVESMMAPWRSMMDNWVRGQMQNANPQNTRPLLEGMGMISVGSQGSGPQETSLWKITVKELLPEERHKAWLQEQDARREYANMAITGAVMRQVQRHCPIFGEEEKRLAVLVQKVVAEYAPDIQNWLSDPWYLNSYYSVIPLAGVPEKDLAQALGADRLKQLKDTALPQAQQYWEGIKQQHEQRVRNGGQGTMIINE